VPLPALDLIEADIARTPLGPLLIPPTQEGDFCPMRRAPAHRVAHRRMTGRHRLAIEADQLLEAARDAGLRVGEFDALGPNAAVATAHAPLVVHP
jgi:hypothetical protein